MNRQEILEFINNTIEEEHGNRLSEDNLLIESNMDSFGYAVFWLGINHEYSIDEVKGIDAGIDYSTLTVKNVIDYIITKDTRHILGGV